MTKYSQFEGLMAHDTPLPQALQDLDASIARCRKKTKGLTDMTLWSAIATEELLKYKRALVLRGVPFEIVFPRDGVVMILSDMGKLIAGSQTLFSNTTLATHKPEKYKPELPEMVRLKKQVEEMTGA